MLSIVAAGPANLRTLTVLLGLICGTSGKDG